MTKKCQIFKKSQKNIFSTDFFLEAKSDWIRLRTLHKKFFNEIR